MNAGAVYTLGCEDTHGDGWHNGYMKIGKKKYCHDFRGGDCAHIEFTVDHWEGKEGGSDVGRSGSPELVQQTPGEDSPDAGFDIYEGYKGQQGAAKGILGMMDVISSDFKRTISETQKAEAQAEEEHLEFMTETGKSLGEKGVVKKQKTAERDDAVEQLGDAEGKLDLETRTLQASIEELIELKAACVDTIMSYDERVARREQEVEALKKALCILNAYQEYGPDGLANVC